MAELSDDEAAGVRELISREQFVVESARVSGDFGDEQSALVVRTAGVWDRFTQNRALLDQDWRDVLVRADLADEDWHHRLDAILGPV